MSQHQPAVQGFPERPLRTRLDVEVAEQLMQRFAGEGLVAGDRLPPEHEGANRLGGDRTSLRQALVAGDVADLRATE